MVNAMFYSLYRIQHNIEDHSHRKLDEEDPKRHFGNRSNSISVHSNNLSVVQEHCSYAFLKLLDQVAYYIIYYLCRKLETN